MSDTCGFAWCDAQWDGHVDHTQSAEYIPASQSTPLSIEIGVGVTVDDEGPSVFVSILDSAGRYDSDAYMTADEADTLAEQLVEAITRCREVASAEVTQR